MYSLIYLTMTETLADWLELERRKQNGDVVTWKIQFFVGNFFVWIRGGEETDAPGYHEHISQCENVEVRLYDRKDGEPPPVWAPLEVAGYKINFDVHVFAHEAIYPRADKRFLEQPWAEKFSHIRSDSLAPPAFLTLDELDIVLQWLRRIDDLVAFT